jgi:hypothetical protein
MERYGTDRFRLEALELRVLSCQRCAQPSMRLLLMPQPVLRVRAVEGRCKREDLIRMVTFIRSTGRPCYE